MRSRELLARRCGGRDAPQTPGLSAYSVLQLISEVGTDMTRWKMEKHFVSWLGLAANMALARKLALLFYRLLRQGLEYVENGLKNYEAKALETEARGVRKLAKKHGFTLIPVVPS